MYARPQLMFWLARQLLPVTIVALPGALIYLLLHSEPLHWRDPWPWVFIFAHCLAIQATLGRFQSSGFAFLYCRGFGRDVLWSHLVIATALAVMAVWLPAALTIWAGLRSVVQDRVFESPYFPIMMPRETWVPLAWLVGYAVFLSVFNYAWIRQAQPTRGRSAGNFIAAGVLVFSFIMINMGFHAPWYAWLSSVCVGGVVLAMLVGAWRLHRRLEVRT